MVTLKLDKRRYIPVKAIYKQQGPDSCIQPAVHGLIIWDTNSSFYGYRTKFGINTNIDAYKGRSELGQADTTEDVEVLTENSTCDLYKEQINTHLGDPNQFRQQFA